MKNVYINNVKRSKRTAGSGGGRIGTRWGVSLQCMLETFGAPNCEFVPREKWWSYVDYNKVSAVWIFDTPRGLVEIRDYWWNDRYEMSISGSNHKAARWMHGYLDLIGFGRRNK